MDRRTPPPRDSLPIGRGIRPSCCSFRPGIMVPCRPTRYRMRHRPDGMSDSGTVTTATRTRRPLGIRRRLGAAAAPWTGGHHPPRGRTGIQVGRRCGRHRGRDLVVPNASQPQRAFGARRRLCRTAFEIRSGHETATGRSATAATVARRAYADGVSRTSRTGGGAVLQPGRP